MGRCIILLGCGSIVEHKKVGNLGDFPRMHFQALGRIEISGVNREVTTQGLIFWFARLEIF